MTSPQEISRLVGHHSPAQEEAAAKSHAGAAFNALMEEETKEGVVVMLLGQFDENRRLRTALRAVRACTDPKWQARLISDALREDQP